MDVLSAAFIVVAIDLHDEEQQVYRSFTFDVAWVADGSVSHWAEGGDPDAEGPYADFVGKDVGAHFTGSMTDTLSLIGLENLDDASMRSGRYLFYEPTD